MHLLLVWGLLLAPGQPSALSAPVWCAGGRQLAWVAELGGERVWMLSTPGHPEQPPAPLQLTPPARPDLSWWSPTGAHLAYLADTRDGRLLYVATPPAVDGKPFAKVGRVQPHVLAWSPDGTRLAFSRVADEGSQTPYEIFAGTVDGAAPVRVAVPAAPRGLVWSPSNDAFAYAAQGRRANNLFVVIPARHAAVSLSNYLDVLPQSMSWAPDGRRLLFAGSGDLNQGARLFIIRRDGRDTADQVRTAGYQSHAPAVWSADGRLVAWIAGPLSRPSRGNLLLGPGDNVHAARPALAGGVPCSQPAFSPDSKYLAFTRWPERPEGRTQVILMVLAEPRACFVVSGDGADDTPVFSPDSKRLAYLHGPDGRRQVAVVDVAGVIATGSVAER